MSYRYDFKQEKLRKVKILLKSLVFFLVLLWGVNAFAVGFSQEMRVEIGVFDAAKITLDYEEGNARYDIKARVMTTNLFDTLYPFSGQYQSVGKILKGGKLLPEEYITSSKTRRHLRKKNVYYGKNGKGYKSVSAKDGKETVHLLDNVPLTADTSDLQTVFAELIKNFTMKRSCDLQREVYDRKKHYRVIIKDVKQENRYFEGLKRQENATQCSIYIENLRDNNDNILWEVSADKPINVWVGYDEKVKMPYLLEIKIDSTPLGELKVLPQTLRFK